MLEIGMNVVILSLEEYEKLKKRAEFSEKMQTTFRFKKSYWNDGTPELIIDTKMMRKEITKAWEDFKDPIKDKFVLAEDPDQWRDYSMSIGVIDRKPEPEQEAKEAKEDSEDV